MTCFRINKLNQLINFQKFNWIISYVDWSLNGQLSTFQFYESKNVENYKIKH